ncbi:zf-HC2 domain-containing protein [Dactylosporangium fulvum]|uniref:Zf-HC2 domain-containing protein n=1 Tax=Dactylosporangium fulvum TaxID=53359 RepID=A0ABY5VV00_9ACTN|nr:zf-HC2 domain-containing protein [Dactylosporangium fulvum]UWP80931.1 zf-HC2 domain-containing protein [Dactylosporangium fulvum]
MSADHEEVRPLLGGYVLGGLDDADQFRVDAHLSTCAGCRAEADRLAPVPELLQRLPFDPAATPLESPTRDGLDAFLRRSRPQRLPLGRLIGVAAAVAVVLAVAALALWPGSAQTPHVAVSASATAGTVVRFVAAAGSGLAGQATLTPRQWGVSVAVELSGLPGEGPFAMHVVDRGGQAEQAACWGRTRTASARVTGASSIQLGNVDMVTISDHDGHLLGTAKAV